ncbi:hypothetical protein ACOSP7_022440 [Xanthoceras sorbifolium]
MDMDLLPPATMPIVGSKYHAAEVESASSSYRRTPVNNMVDLPSDDDIIVSHTYHHIGEDTEGGEDESYSPVSGGWISKESDESETYNGIAGKAKREVPFRVDPSGKIKLEVGQIFQNLHHFRQVIRDFAVGEGFQLRRIKNERDTYTAECAYEGCRWRIHASPTDDRRTFMIKTMEPQHSYQKVHKNQKANVVWVVKRAKRRVLEKIEYVNCKSYNMFHTYGSIVRERNLSSMVITRAGCMSFKGVYRDPSPRPQVAMSCSRRKMAFSAVSNATWSPRPQIAREISRKQKRGKQRERETEKEKKRRRRE